MKRSFIIILASFLFCFSCNQSAKNKNSNNVDFTKKYEGSIDGKYKITVNIHKSVNNEITGTYYYKTIGTTIIMKGNIADGKATLKGFDNNGNNIDLFEGKFSDDYAQLSGNWSKPDGSRTAKFTIKEVLSSEKNDSNDSGTRNTDKCGFYSNLKDLELSKTLPTHIETILLPENQDKKNCFDQWESCYPKISGLINKSFENKINKQVENIALSFIANKKKEYACNDCDCSESITGFFGWVHVSFEILTHNTKFISFVIYLSEGGGGKAWYDYVKVFNIDIAKNEIIDLGYKYSSKLTVKKLNNCIKNHFDKEVEGGEESIGGYPYVEGPISKLDFGIRNDSLLYITPFNTGFTYLRGVRLIMIDNLNNLK